VEGRPKVNSTLAVKYSAAQEGEEENLIWRANVFRANASSNREVEIARLAKDILLRSFCRQRIGFESLIYI